MKWRAFLLLFLFLSLISPVACDTPPPPSHSSDDVFRVLRVVDGDTIVVEGGYRIRYIGIDTPETVHPSKPVECFGPEASRKNRALVDGREVRLEPDAEDKDQYGRYLRYVYVDDLMVNAELVRQGYARVVFYPPNTAYETEFRQLESQARERELGLWGACE